MVDAENEAPQLNAGNDDTVSLSALKSRLKSRIKRLDADKCASGQQSAVQTEGAATPLKAREPAHSRTPLVPSGDALTNLIQSLEQEDAACEKLPREERQARLSSAYLHATKQIGPARTPEGARIWLRYALLQA